jgi:hypothetical protein
MDSSLPFPMTNLAVSNSPRNKDSLKRRQFQSVAMPIGLILIAIWCRLWQCVIEYNGWSVDVCLSSVQTQRFALGLEYQKRKAFGFLGLDFGLLATVRHG